MRQVSAELQAIIEKLALPAATAASLRDVLVANEITDVETALLLDSDDCARLGSVGRSIAMEEEALSRVRGS